MSSAQEDAISAMKMRWMGRCTSVSSLQAARKMQSEVPHCAGIGRIRRYHRMLVDLAADLLQTLADRPDSVPDGAPALSGANHAG